MFVVGLLLISPQPSEAARGGRIGGGSFRAPSSAGDMHDAALFEAADEDDKDAGSME